MRGDFVFFIKYKYGTSMGFKLSESRRNQTVHDNCMRAIRNTRTRLNKYSTHESSQHEHRNRVSYSNANAKTFSCSSAVFNLGYSCLLSESLLFRHFITTSHHINNSCKPLSFPSPTPTVNDLASKKQNNLPHPYYSPPAPPQQPPN